MDMLHIVYLANWFMGGLPISVSAWIDRRLPGDSNVEDIALVRFDYDTGHALVNMAWGVGPGGVEIGGTRGRLVMETKDHATHPFVPAERLNVVTESGLRSWSPGAAPQYGMAGIAADFRDAVKNGTKPVASGEEGLTALDAILGAYVAGALQRQVSLPLPPDHPVYCLGAAGIAELTLPAGSPVLRRGLYGATATG
jgi:predicted dehydrogenase